MNNPTIADFLSTFNKIISSFVNNDNENITLYSSVLKDTYNVLNSNERSTCFQYISDFFNEQNDTYITIFFMSYLLKTLNSAEAIIHIQHTISQSGISPIDALNIIFQMSSFSFSTDLKIDTADFYKEQLSIYQNNISKLNSLTESYTFVPYDVRNKDRIAIMCRMLYSDRHAPTVIIINLFNWLKKLGYEVCLFIEYMGQIQDENVINWYRPSIENKIFSQAGDFNINYLGVDIKGHNIVFSNSNYEQMARRTFDLIYDYNPLFVINVGGCNPIADLCNNITTVCCMPCINKPALSTSSIYIRYFPYTEDDDRIYNDLLLNYQHVYDMPFVEELSGSNGCIQVKSDYGIDEDKFAIIIAGNRLDKEIRQRFIQLLNDISSTEDNVVFVFIGDCPLLKNTLKYCDFYNKCVFTGAVSNFKGAVSIGDLFLNPPRQGGSTGAYYAIECGIPVLTLPSCDVASVGNAFTCHTIDEMSDIIHRYMHDSEYMNQQIQNCRSSFEKICSCKDNLPSITSFISKLKEYMNNGGR